ncbi:MAG: flagellar M-ring protein FliF [Clostridiales bacterium]|nr:flagellar M-ring protein FliF [Clostridiales bacterium]
MKGPKDLFSTIRKQIGEFFSKTSKGKLIRIGILAALFLVVVIVGVSLLSTASYSVLYSGMEAKDAGEIMDVLSSMGVDARAEGTDTILVASDKVDSLRMELSAQGYPKSGVNYDIFEKASGLGTTDMEKRTYLQFQLQANLRSTILMLDGVKDAAVSISMADDSAFVLSGEDKPATAAIMLDIEKGTKLTQSQVQAIGELVSKSVPGGLSLENIRIIDSQMNLYDLTGNDPARDVGSHFDLQAETRDNLQEQIINLLTPVFGGGNVLAEVNVLLDFDKKTTEEVKFAPPIEGETEGIAVSVKDLAETIKNYGGASGTTGVDSNGGANSYPAADAEGDAVYDKVSKETNLEVNQTKSRIESAQGQIKELSVAIILNSTLDLEDYSGNVKDLVAKAVGVEPANITVERLPFKDAEGTQVADAFTQQQELLSAAQTGTLIRVIVIALAAVVIAFFIIRALRSLASTRRAAAAAAEAGTEFVVDDSGGIAVQLDAEAPTQAQLNKKEIEEYIEKNAESVAQLLRNWLTDD